MCVGVFALGYVMGVKSLDIYSLGMIPDAISIDHQWYRLITSAFLHGGFLHIAFNMFALYQLGPALEALLGSKRFLALYLIAALGGGVASYLFSAANTVSVGASGAIFGLMTASIVVGRQIGADISQIALWLGINVLIGFSSPGIDWRAHLGGAITGAVVASIQTNPSSGRTAREATQLGLLVTALLVLVAVGR